MATSALLALLVASSIRSVRSASGYTYPFSFFNITVPVGGVDPIGNVEIYVCSINATESYLSVSCNYELPDLNVALCFQTGIFIY